jgi:pimeloyl-ACP methyl ester carboxylesterase
VGTSAAWAAGAVPVEVVAGAGHLLEWDAPDEVGTRLVELLAST